MRCGEGLICVSPAAFHGFVDCPFQSCGAKIRQRRIRPSWNAGSYSRITSCACTRHRHQQILAPIEPPVTSPGQWEPPPDLRPGFDSLGHRAPPGPFVFVRTWPILNSGMYQRQRFPGGTGNRWRFSDRLDGCRVRLE